MATNLALITGYAKDPEFVKVLLLALKAQTYKDFDCYIYAAPGTMYYLDDHFLHSLPFNCFHLKLEKNWGFAGNNNFAIHEAFKKNNYTYAVLANDDTVPEDSWLEEMLKAASTSDKIGAVAPKMVFYQRFVTITGVTSTSRLADNRPLGLRFYLNTGFSGSFYPKKFFTAGFFHQEEDEINPFKWTADTFKVEIPYAQTAGKDYTLRLFLAKNPLVKDQRLKILVGSKTVASLLVTAGKIFYEVTVPAELIDNASHYIIQNAGGSVIANTTRENGFGEIDRGQYNTSQEVSLFCGGACLLTRKALEEAGLFMDGLFSYYEDAELSMRLQKKGFKILYYPKAVIKHYHTGTSKEWSPLFTYYAFRNQIIFSAKIFGLKAFIKAFRERSRETYVYFKLFVKSRFRNQDYKQRLALNLAILKGALIGIVKFKPKFLTK